MKSSKSVAKRSNSSWVGLLYVVLPIVILATFVIWLLIGKSSESTTSGKITVVAAENFWGDVAKQLGGDKVSVTSVISDPSADPHLYESDARDASAIANADLVVTNGLGYDDFMDKLLSASPSNRRQIIKVADVLNARGNDVNPHLWYDLPRVGQIAQAIEVQLVAKDPADKAMFEKNLASFNASLQPLLAKIQEIKTKYPNAPVAYTERVPGYLTTNAGLQVLTPVGFASAIESGNEPSANDQAEMTSLIANHKVKVLLYNAQATSPVTQRLRDLAQKQNIPVIGVTETLPASEPNYQKWQGDQLDSLLAALKNGYNNAH